LFKPLFLAHFAANQLAGSIVILDDIDIAALLRIALHDRELAVSEFLDFLGLAIEIVIVDLADQNAMSVFLDKIYLAVKVPVAFNLDELVVAIGLDDVRVPIAVRVDGNLLGVLVDPVYPLVRASIVTTVRDRAVGFPTTGNEAESNRCREDRSLPHASLYPALNLVSTLLFRPDGGLARAAVSRHQD
jgi:hypothetical protein